MTGTESMAGHNPRTPVWVHVDRLLPPPPHGADGPPSGVPYDAREPVPGWLYMWLRTTGGAWFAIVTYTLPGGYSPGGMLLRDQLVPRWALSKREDVATPARRQVAIPTPQEPPRGVYDPDAY